MLGGSRIICCPNPLLFPKQNTPSQGGIGQGGPEMHEGCAVKEGGLSLHALLNLQRALQAFAACVQFSSIISVIIKI